MPTHSHADRPAIIFIVSGEIVEHSSKCAEPIVHKAGDSIAEFGPGLEHWWENVGRSRACSHRATSFRSR